MKRFILLQISLFVSMLAQAQLTNNGAVLTIGTGAVVQVNTSLRNFAGSNLINNGTINLRGDLTNHQTMSLADNGTLTFEGSGAQTVLGSKMFFSKNITFNCNGDIILFTIGLKADGEVKFQKGFVNGIHTFEPLVFSASAYVSLANPPTNSSHVRGYVVKEGTGAFTYPVGDGTRYQPVSTALTANGSGMRAIYLSTNAGSGPFGTTGASAAPLGSYNTQEYWDLTPLSTATGTVTVFWDDYKTPSLNYLNMIKVAHKSDGNWLNEDGTATGTLGAGSVTSASMSSWSPFTLGLLPSLAVSIVNQTNVTCNGSADGTATALATGGAPPVMYMWNTTPTQQTTATATGLAAGIYTVTATDANMIAATASVTITQPTSKPVMTAALATAGAKCSDVTFGVNLGCDSTVLFCWTWTGTGITGAGAYASNPGCTGSPANSTTLNGSFNNVSLVQKTAVVKFVAKTGSGCVSDTVPVTVLLNPEPKLQPFSPPSQTICNGTAMTNLISKLDSTAIFSGVQRVWFRDNATNVPTAVPTAGANNAGGILNLAAGVTTNQVTNFRFVPKVLATGCVGDTVTVPVTVLYAPSALVVKPVSKTQNKNSGDLIDTINAVILPPAGSAVLTWTISAIGASLGGTCFSDNTLPINGTIVNFTPGSAGTARWIFRAKTGTCFGKADTAYVNVAAPSPGSEPASGSWLDEVVDFRGHREGKRAILSLHTANILELGDYRIEKSANGRDFALLAVIPAAEAEALRDGKTVYDETPAPGMNYYRLRQVSPVVDYGASRVVAINFGTRNLVSVSPNPTASQLNVAVEVETPAATSMKLYDAQMRVVLVKNLNLPAGRHNELLDLTTLPAGLYFVKVDGLPGQDHPAVPFVKE